MNSILTRILPLFAANGAVWQRQNVAGGPQYPLEFTVLRALESTVI